VYVRTACLCGELVGRLAEDVRFECLLHLSGISRVGAVVEDPLHAVNDLKLGVPSWFGKAFHQEFPSKAGNLYILCECMCIDDVLQSAPKNELALSASFGSLVLLLLVPGACRFASFKSS